MFSNKFVHKQIALAVIACAPLLATAQTVSSGPAPTTAPVTAPNVSGPTNANPSSALTAVGNASASAPAVQPRQSVTAAEIASINERMAVLSARLAEMELLAKISSKSGEIKRLKGGLEVTDDGYIPSVVDINGVDGNLWSTLSMQGGNIQTVRVGDRVGRWVVRAITIDSVTVQSGKESLRLAFGTYTPSAQPNMGLPAGGMQPPLPTIR